MSDQFSATVRDKASKLTDIDQDPDHADVWWVLGSKYRVQVITYLGDTAAICTCPNGQRNSPSRCYHAAAVIERSQGGFPEQAIELGEDGK